MIKCIVIEPGKEPVLKELKNDFKAIQDVVGGYIEHIRPIKDSQVIFLFDEDAKLKRTQINLSMPVHPSYPSALQPIRGTIVICGYSKDEFVSLDDQETKAVMEWIELNTTRE